MSIVGSHPGDVDGRRRREGRRGEEEEGGGEGAPRRAKADAGLAMHRVERRQACLFDSTGSAFEMCHPAGLYSPSNS